MSKVRFFALGGLGETGKNLYVLEVENDIFVLDCGSNIPATQLFGYDSIIPDITYLKENSERVKGIFLTHFSMKSVGGFPRVIKDIKAPCYASEYTISAIQKRYIPHIPDEEKEGLEFVKVEKNQKLDFGSCKVEFFNVANTLPDTFALSFKVNVANEGEEESWKNILYLPDFNFDQNVKGHFRTDFKALTRIADEGVLVLLSPSTGAAKIGHITTDGKLDLALHKLLSHPGRSYILMDAENVSGMVHVIDAVKFQKRKVTIIGSKARTLVELAMDMGYTDDYSECYYTKSVLNDEIRNSDDAVIIIAGEQTEEFYALQRIATYQDPHFTLKSTDNVIFLMEVPKKHEKVLANTWDNIWIDNANLIEFDTKLMPDAISGAEDIKLLYGLLSPEYIIPIEGDYRMIKSQVQLALEYGYDQKNIIELENGSIVTFENGKLSDEVELVQTGDILFGLETDSDINDYVAREREALSQEGFIVMSAMISLKEREIVGDIEYVQYGFLAEYGSEHEAMDIVKNRFKEIVNAHLRLKKVDYKELRLDLKNDLSKVILKEMKKKPTLIPVIIDISSIANNQSKKEEIQLKEEVLVGGNDRD